MALTHDDLEAGDPGICAWIGFWAQLAALAVLAVLGAYFAGADNAPGDDTCGLVLSLGAIALAFLRLKRRFDGGSGGDWGSFVLVDDLANLVPMMVVLVVLALAGLFIAAAYDYGGLHDAGVALFVASALAVFLNLKRVFDNLDRQP